MKSCTIGATGILVFILAVLLLVSPASAWLTGYGYEKNLTLSTSGWTSSVSNNTLYIHVFRTTGTDAGSAVYVGSNVETDFDDIRFTDTSDTVLSHWLQSTNGTNDAQLWVKVPSVSNTTNTVIKMYYKNSTVATASTTATWEDYDDFTGASLNATRWSSSGTVAVGSGFATVGVSPDPGTIYSNTNYGSGKFVLWNSTFNGTANNVNLLGFYSNGFNWKDSNTYLFYGGTQVGGSINIDADGGYTSVTIPTSGYNTYIIKKGVTTLYYGVNPTSNSYSSKTGYTIDTEKTYFYSSPGYSRSMNWYAIGNCGNGDPTYTWASAETEATAAFTANSTVVAPGANVSFTDQSSGSPTAWYWDTNEDGVIENTTQNCTAIYSSSGLYDVTLTITKNGINSTLTKSDYISVGQAPLASFTTNKTSGTNPVYVQFNDTSIRSPTWYNWSWGEGGVNTTTQNATHGFTSSGSFVVIFSAANAYGSSSNSTTITVQSSNNASGYGQYYAAQTVTFHVQSPFGAPIQGATVTMQGTATSSGSWDWLGQLLGIRFNETPINTQIMTATTDSNGDAQFFVFPTTIYSVHVLKAGVVDKTLTVTPTDAKYVIPVDWNVFGDTGSVLAAVSFNVTTSDFNATAKKITVTGTDTLNHFTGGTVKLNQTVNGTETNLQTQGIPANNFTMDFIVTNYKGQSYLVRVNATQSDYGNIIRDYGVAFPKDKVNPMGLDNKLLMLISMGILILFGAIFTSTTAHNGALLTCFIGWVLYGLGWMDYGGTTIPLALTFATVISVAIIILVGRDKS